VKDVGQQMPEYDAGVGAAVAFCGEDVFTFLVFDDLAADEAADADPACQADGQINGGDAGKLVAGDGFVAKDDGKGKDKENIRDGA